MRQQALLTVGGHCLQRGAGLHWVAQLVQVAVKNMPNWLVVRVYFPLKLVAELSWEGGSSF